MTTAKEFASAAANMREAATEFKPDDSDPYATSRRLIQYLLISAANRTRSIAEALERKERQS
jgi:hypothetical protein